MGIDNKLILFIGVALTTISCLYFLSLLININILITIFLIISFLLLTFNFLFLFNKQPITIKDCPNWYFLIGFIGIMLITKTATQNALKHGDWDAWGLWNYHSKFLTDNYNWKKLFQNRASDHADYPLNLPASIAFLQNITLNRFELIIPFIISLSFTLCIPTLIYLEILKENLVVAIITLFLWSHDIFFINLGISQYADVLVSFYFLGAFVCMQYSHENKWFISLAAFFLFSCAWTKNEGLFIALIFFVFYLPVFFSKKNILHTLTGSALPLTAIIAFKLSCSIPNDMIAGLTHGSWHYLIKLNRYKLIFSTLMQNINDKFYAVKLGVMLYAILCLIEKKLPEKNVLLLFVCMMVYFLVYVITPHDLKWHLETSQNRLLAQLLPSAVYILALKFSKIKFNLVKSQL